MLSRQWLACVTAAVAFAAPKTIRSPEIPSEITIVSEVHWDFGPPFWDMELLNIQRENADVVVRLVEIQPFENRCVRTKIVKVAEKRLPNTTMTTFVSGKNPCAVTAQELERARRRRPHELVLTSFGQGIVATCGSERRKLALLPIQMFSSPGSGKTSDVQGLWNLLKDTATIAFGKDGVFEEQRIFSAGIEGSDWEAQQAGRLVVPELNSGRYDDALSPDCDAKGRNCKNRTFKEILSDYVEPRLPVNPIPTLRNAAEFQFDGYVTPIYPPIAQAAGISGQVEVSFTVSPTTGEVTTAEAVSGHPMLKGAAAEAVKRWRLDPMSSSRTQKAVFDFTLKCP